MSRQMVVGTLTGSRYAVTEDSITRLVAGEGRTLRRDHEPIKVQRWVQPPACGKPMVMLLEPLGEGAAATIRATTKVTWIRHFTREEE